MRVELPYRCWQVPSSFSSGRRCKSFQRAERQSKHWLQMEGRVTIFPLSLFSRRVHRLSSFLISPCCFISFAFAGRPSSLRLSGGTCNHIFRIRGWHTFTILFPLFPKDARAAREDEWKTILTTISFPLIASTCRRFVYPLSYIEDAPCFTRCRGSILISASETELSIYLSITFLVNVGKLAIKADLYVTIYCT